MENEGRGHRKKPTKGYAPRPRISCGTSIQAGRGNCGGCVVGSGRGQAQRCRVDRLDAVAIPNCLQRRSECGGIKKLTRHSCEGCRRLFWRVSERSRAALLICLQRSTRERTWPRLRLVCPGAEFDSLPSEDWTGDMAETTPVTITILNIERVA
jgi:hypothetical protein